MSIWETQAIHDAVTSVLRNLQPGPRARRAFVEVATPGKGTKAALMTRAADGSWTIAALYVKDHDPPGTVGVRVVGVW
jgi:hypothetical protein